ncbi:hypothetical protein SASPL_117400 [Salvia splendens]|uniref:Uncharacterized protein n=1 Tax=Salvia splendens TaxID=180675 RepID=A0A8X8XZM4_SALSN|nr:hypothetical protein SASPL_117400 [Salvia splendens]
MLEGKKIMDYESLPQFCRKEGSGSSRVDGEVSDCFSLNHPFHQQLYNYVKEQAARVGLTTPLRHGSFHVDCPVPDPADVKIAETIECELQRLGNQNGLSHSSSCELKNFGIVSNSIIRCSSFGGLSFPSSGQCNAAIFENAEFDDFVV